MAKKLINANKIPKDKTTYTRPEGAGNFDNMDDKNIVEQINIKIGTCDITPTLDKHIANKKYVDTNDPTHWHSKLSASDGAGLRVRVRSWKLMELLILMIMLL